MKSMRITCIVVGTCMVAAMLGCKKENTVPCTGNAGKFLLVNNWPVQAAVFVNPKTGTDIDTSWLVMAPNDTIIVHYNPPSATTYSIDFQGGGIDINRTLRSHCGGNDIIRAFNN